MFKRLNAVSLNYREDVVFFYEGKSYVAKKGDTVAAAMLANGFDVFRTTPVSDSPRAPYCMMGVCFECLLEIDGVPNVQSCQTEVADGMTVKPQCGARRLGCEPS